MAEKGEFLEYAEYVGNYYGTPLKPIYDHIDRGINVFLDVEVQGHKNIIEKMPEAVSSSGYGRIISCSVSIP